MPPPITPIPVPTDGCDPPHSAIAMITSLRCMAESFDAVMDSLQSSIDRESERLDLLSERAERCRDILRKQRAVGNGGEGAGDPIVVRLPREHGIAIAGFEGKSTADDAVWSTPSAISAAREASNGAVRRVLRRDVELDDSGATVSDLWLDRPRAFDVGAACRAALESHAVPLLGMQRPLPDGVEFYKNAMEGGDGVGAMKGSGGVGRTASFAGSSSSPSDWGGMAGGVAGMGDEVSAAASVRTGISLSTRATNAAAGATASDRRRQRQFNNLAKKRQGAAGGNGGAGSSSGEGAAVASASATSSRQQVASGSQPYLCEILHDAYGVGAAPPDGESGTVFPAPRVVGELRVFQTGRLAYGTVAAPTFSPSRVESGVADTLPPSVLTPRMKGSGCPSGKEKGNGGDPPTGLDACRGKIEEKEPSS